MSYLASDSARENAAAALSLVASASGVVGHAMLSSDPRNKLAAPPTTGASAAATVSLLRAVANDHLQGFIQLLDADVPRTSSMAAIVRSCIETWARARWLIAAPSAVQAQYRARQMVVEELKEADRRGVEMLSGEPIAEAIARATRERDTIEEAFPESMPPYTKLAVGSLAPSDTDASTIYSHLSGVAHGEVIFTSSLATDPLGESQGELALPAQNLVSYCSWIFTATAAGMFDLFEHWDLPTDATQAFSRVVISVAESLSSMSPP